MKKQDALADESESDLNSSTSSYSEIIPRQDNFAQVRKDKPIIIRSIPMNKPKKQTTNNNLISNSQTVISSTMITSIHANTNLQQSNSSHLNKNDILTQNMLNSSKTIKSQKSQKEANIINEILVKSTYEKYNQALQNQANLSKKEEQGSKSDQQNVALNFSMSSMASQKQQQNIPKQPFKMYFESPEKKQQEAEEEVKQYIEAIKKLKKQEQKKDPSVKGQNFHIQVLIKRNKQLESRIIELQSLIKTESESMIMERKANEVYTQFYHTLSKMITKFISINKNNSKFLFQVDSIQPLNQSMNMEKILQTIDKLIQIFQNKRALPSLSEKYIQTQLIQKPQNTSQSEKDTFYSQKIQQLQALLNQADERNNQLKNELLQSTQNNISAIFNTELSASCCLQNQVSKINTELNFLKEKMNILVNKDKPIVSFPPQPPQIIYLSQPSPVANPSLNEKIQVNKIVKIYTTKQKYRKSSDEQEGLGESESKKRKHSFSKKRKRSARSQKSISSSSLSSKSTKKREQMSKKQIQNLKQAYNHTKNQLNSLIQTFSLITNSQNQMRNYFNQIKEEVIRGMNQRMNKTENQLEKRQLTKNKQIELIKQRQINLDKQLRQKMREKQEVYLNQIEFMKKEKQEDRKVIVGLNEKIIDLINAVSVPERVNQDYRNMKNGIYNDDQIPASQFSISVDYLKMIQQLKHDRQNKNTQIQQLLKQNQFLKQEIINLKTIQIKSNVIKNINNSIDSSRQRKQSIINELNGFTEMSISPPLLINTHQNYHPTKNRNMHVSQTNKHVSFNNQLPGKHVVSVHKIDTQKVLHDEPHNNFQKNFKAILNSKQTHIRHLQQQILNLQQMTQYLKGQISCKQTIIQDLENYISNLQNRSVNSISLSSPSGMMAETNPYFEQENTSQNVRSKYQNYVKNLKILLKQTRNQNKILREQIQNYQVQADQLTQSNFGLKNSATHSQRTTKNFPNSNSPGHVNSKAQGQIIIRKRVENNEKFEGEKYQQRINNLASDTELPEQIQRIKPKGKIPF